LGIAACLKNKMFFDPGTQLGNDKNKNKEQWRQDFKLLA